MFNSIDSQQAMLQVSQSQREIIKINDFDAWFCISICSSYIRIINCIC